MVVFADESRLHLFGGDVVGVLFKEADVVSQIVEDEGNKDAGQNQRRHVLDWHTQRLKLICQRYRGRWH